MMRSARLSVRKKSAPDAGWFAKGASRVHSRARTVVMVCVIALLTARLASAEDIRYLKTAPTDILDIYKDNSADYRDATEIGARIVNLHEYGTFFVYWLPPDFESLEEKRVLVILHGQNGNAYRHLVDFCQTAMREKIGIISVQWGWPNATFRGTPDRRIVNWAKSYTYLPSDIVYEIMSTALEHMEYRHGINKHLSAWHGFSKSSTDCVLYAFYDTYTENDYFRLFIVASGEADPNQKVIPELKAGIYGDKPLRDKNFYLWCGMKDGNRCQTMQSTKELVEALGGTVQIFRSGPEGRGGFENSEDHQKEAVTLWKSL